MYYNGQIIWDCTKKVPVRIQDIWDTKQYPKKNTHLVYIGGEVFMSMKLSIKKVKELVEGGMLKPFTK